QQALGAPAVGAPIVEGDLVYVSTRDSQGWAIETGTGRVRWQLSAAPSPAGRIGSAGPVVAGRLVLFPFASGEISALLRKSGLRVWNGYAVGGRDVAAYSAISDITGAPVIASGAAIVGNPAGRTVALDLTDGSQRWAAPFGAMSRVWVAGDSVFLLSDTNQLVRLDLRSGRLIWAADLPFFEKTRAKRRRDVFAHFGPILAGGSLLVASDDGLIRRFDPQTGAERDSIEIPAGAASNPIVVGETLYIVTGDGTLRAFR
ncbi:MAG: PQQ-binding-like beta-propeller repeat protein, partial [Alphaproteobacteria bacterium]|nr:PQQ-binding-like beta-propeller repeat protein [Alphaproteobacteria bacterium]